MYRREVYDMLVTFFPIIMLLVLMAIVALGIVFVMKKIKK